jgi:hypothetical protein
MITLYWVFIILQLEESVNLIADLQHFHSIMGINFAIQSFIL